MIIDLMQERIKKQKLKMKDTLWYDFLSLISWVHHFNKVNQIKILTAALDFRTATKKTI